MKSFEDIEQMVRDSKVMASGATDQRILGHALDIHRDEKDPVSQGTEPDEAPTPRHTLLGRLLKIAALFLMIAGLLALLFPSPHGIVPASIAWADIQQAISQQAGVFITGTRKCTFPATQTAREQVYEYRTEKWASDAGYIDSTLEADGTPVLHLCYHFDTGTVTLVYHFLKQYYRFQVPDEYRDRVRDITPLGLVEILFQSGATSLEPRLIQGRQAVGFEVSDLAHRLDESLGPKWMRSFFFNLTQTNARLWVDTETRLPIYMQGDFLLERCLFSDFAVMRWEETSGHWQWGTPVEDSAFFPEMPQGYQRMDIPQASPSGPSSPGQSPSGRTGAEGQPGPAL